MDLDPSIFISSCALDFIHLNSTFLDIERLARRLPFKHSDIEGYILCSLISGPTNINKATTVLIINVLHYHFF